MDISNESENYIRLGILLLDIGTPTVQDIFRSRYKHLTGSPWTHTPGVSNNFLKTLAAISKEASAAYSNLPKDERNLLKDEDVTSWDLTLLYTVLKNIDCTQECEKVALEHAKENDLIKTVKDVRNKYAHSSKRRIPQRKFHKWWSKAEEALISLGVPEESMRDVKESGIVRSFQNFDLPTHNFTGRIQLLQKIHNQLTKCSSKKSCLDRIVVLRGLGGMGKSELARMYAHTYIEDRNIQNVAWINAENLSSLKASFVSLSNSLKLSSVNQEIEEIVKNVYEHFSEHIGTGLFIFDNSQQLNDRPFGIFKYLPNQSNLERCPLILVTARDKQWEIPNPQENIIAVDELSEVESVELLSKKFQLTKHQENNEDYKEAIRSLATAFQGYPLGLALATSNIDNAEWTDLKEEIESYLSRMRVPEGGWVSDEQTGAATNYALIMEDVWDVTLEKIQGLKRGGPEALELLNIMAYLPPDDITVEKLKKIFKISYNKQFTNQVFLVLEKYSLVSIHKDEEVEWWNIDSKHEQVRHRIRIHRLVKHCLREKLDKKKDFTYLSSICNYLSSQISNDDENKFKIRNTMVYLHEYLEGRKWPHGTISSSVVFCSALVGSLNHIVIRRGIQIAEDVYDFLDFGKHSDSHTAVLDEILVEKDVLNCYLMCIFCIRYKSGSDIKNLSHKLWVNPNPLLCNEQLQRVFTSFIKLSVEELCVSGCQSRLSHLQKHCCRLCLSVLQDMRDDRKWRTQKIQFGEIEQVVLTAMKTNIGCNLDNMSEIYTLLWEFFHSVELRNSIQFMEALLLKHFEVYPTLECSLEKLSTYWKYGGPLEFGRFMDVCRTCSGDERKLILDSFFTSGGVQVFVNYFVFTCQQDITDSHTYFIVFIRKLAYDWGYADQFIKSAEFLNSYHNYTKRLGECEDKNLDLIQLRCLLSWFGIFTRQNDCFLVNVNSYASELNMLLERVVEGGWMIYYDNDVTDSKDILPTFLQTHKDKSEFLAVQVAKRFYKIFWEDRKKIQTG